MQCDKKYYVYRHYKPSSIEVFYIGLGSQINYKRAYTVFGRNNIWNNIYNKHGYIVEIIADNLTKEEACELEILLISEYGRIDQGTGTLSNLTDGGEGTSSVVYDPIRIQNWRDSIGDNLYDISRHIGTGKDSNRAKEVINIETGIFYETAKYASESLTVSYSCVKQMLSNSRHNYTSLRYVDDFIKNISVKEKSKIGVSLINSENEVFDSIVSCAKHYKIPYQKVISILSGRVYNDIGIRYLNKKNNNLKYKKITLKSEKYNLNFCSFREASDKLSINRNTLKTWVYNNRNVDIISRYE